MRSFITILVASLPLAATACDGVWLSAEIDASEICLGGLTAQYEQPMSQLR